MTYDIGHPPLRGHREKETKMKTTVKNGRVTWFCDACGKPIAARAGYLEVDNAAAARRSALVAVRVRQHNDWKPVDPSTYPPRVRWTAHHLACDPNPDACGYWFAVERINTLRRVIGWTAHLAEKGWFDYTDWASHVLPELGESA